MKLQHLLDGYGKERGLSALNVDESGICRVVINDSLVISIEKSFYRKGFFFYAIVGSIPIGRECEVSKMAMQGNLFGKETGTASLGFLENMQDLILFEYLEEDGVDLALFEEKFNTFTECLVYWVNKLEQDLVPKMDDIDFQKHQINTRDQDKLKIFFA